MLIRVIHDFIDLENRNAKRRQNQILNVSDKRGKEIIKKGYAVKADYIDLSEKDLDKNEKAPAKKTAQKTEEKAEKEK